MGVARWRAEGATGRLDRSSAPQRRPTRLSAERIAAIEALRRLRMTAAEIAECLGLALSTVSRWLKRIGLVRLSRLQPPEPPNRYERRHAGELLHLDIKKLGRISVLGAGHRVAGHRRSQFTVGRKGLRATGWEFVHVCVDDAGPVGLNPAQMSLNEPKLTIRALCETPLLQAERAPSGDPCDRLVSDRSGVRVPSPAWKDLQISSLSSWVLRE